MALLPGDAWQCLETVFLVTDGGGGFYLHQVVESRDVAHICKMLAHQAPTVKNSVVYDVSGAEVEGA